MSQALQTANLSDEALAFVKAGTPTAKVVGNPPAPTAEAASTNKMVEPLPASRSEDPTKEPTVALLQEAKKGEAETSAKDAAPKPRRSKQTEPAASSAGFVSMTFRLPPEIPSGLVRASADRKIKKIRPYTQQEIVAEALSQWLERNGFDAFQRLDSR
jgi:hypothetical protein